MPDTCPTYGLYTVAAIGTLHIRQPRVVCVLRVHRKLGLMEILLMLNSLKISQSMPVYGEGVFACRHCDASGRFG